MRHTSVPMMEYPCEFINVTPVNPLISKCQIKVCYVGDNPNRNRSIITKEVATQMANSLPGSPIVGFYNEAKEDFEEHNRVIDISNGKFEISFAGDVPKNTKVVSLNNENKKLTRIFLRQLSASRTGTKFVTNWKLRKRIQ